MAPPGRRLILLLALGLVSVSFGSILARLGQEAPPLVIAFFRLFWASILLFPFYLRAGRTRGAFSPFWLLAAGVALALHFAFWITSLAYTSVAVSVVLTDTAPLPAALFSYLFFGERLRWRGAAGIALTLLGGAWLVSHDLATLGTARGALLALAGGVSLSFYFVAGRRLRSSGNLWGMIYPVTLVATLLLGVLVLARGLPLGGYAGHTWIFLVLGGVVPQAVGHTSYNWALRSISATVVSTLLLAEPVLASLLAWGILGEALQWRVAGSAGLILAGIFLVSWRGVAALPRRTVAAVLLVREDQIFVEQRRHGSLAGLWEFPGGHLVSAETPMEAARREVLEEVGLELRPEQILPLHVERHSYPDCNLEIHFFKAPAPPGWEGRGGRWVRAEELLELPTPEANRPLLLQLAGRFSQPRQK